MKKIILIDGNSLSYRAYYATAIKKPLLQTNDGIPTNALYSMSNMMYSILFKYKPDHILVAFDAKGKTFRHDKLKTYKGNRKKTPPELISQLALIKEILTLMKIKTYEISGFEADDIIATLASQAGASEEYKTLIISSDKDLYQMVNDQQNIRMFQNSTGMSRGNLINEAYIKENYGVSVAQFGDYKSLIGDSSDNLSGVRGIGKKTAEKLLNDYQNLEEIYENIDNIKTTIATKLKADRDNAFLTQELVTLKTDMELPFTLADTEINVNDIANPAVFEFLETYEMYSFLRKVKKIYHQNNQFEIDIAQVSAQESITIDMLDTQKPWAIYCELLDTNYHSAKLFKIIISDGERHFFINDEEALINNYSLQSKLLDPKIIKYCFDWKKDYLFLKRFHINLTNVKWDLSLAIYLINSNIDIEWWAISKNLGFSIIDDKEYYNNIDNKKISDKLNYDQFLISKINVIFKSFDLLNKKLKAQNLSDLYYNLELPLVLVLARIEKAGVFTDSKIFNDAKTLAVAKLKVLSAQIFALTNCEFNINSPKQLQEILFEKLALKTFNKRKSTAKAVLLEISKQHPVVGLIIEYRNFFKLLTTYIEGMMKFIDQNNEIHSIYLQNKTTSGRLSSKFPNMQNIVEHKEEQRHLKKAFIARKDKILISFDYSQIELRLLAFLSKDQESLDDFAKGLDIHRQTASKLFDKKPADITSIERHQAKTINFGLIYGQSEFALSNALGISFQEARTFMDKYFQQFPKIQQYKADQIKAVQEHKFATTYFNRRRWLPDIDSPNFKVRAGAERIAINMPIQGTAADLLKLALLKVNDIIDWNTTTIIATIHDEIVIETNLENYQEISDKIKNAMETIDSNFLLSVSVNSGNSWYDLK